MDFVDGINPQQALTAPSAIPRDVQHSVNEAGFRMQMGVFDRMRATESEFRARARAVAPVNATRESGPSALPFVPRALDRRALLDHPHGLLLDRVQHVLLGLQMQRGR